MSAGKSIVEKSKSPFVDDETLARFIDFAIEDEKVRATVDEQERIEKMIAKMTMQELQDAKALCERLHAEFEICERR